MKTIGETSHTSESTNIDPGDDMNMNIDDPTDYRELNTQISNYVVAEFVAVPSDFDMKSHLSMREQVGIFDVKKMDLAKANTFIEGVKYSPVFSTMNNALLDPTICFFVLNLFGELGLILKTIDNPFRRVLGNEHYMRLAKDWDDQRFQYVRGQEVSRLSFIIINVTHLFSDDIYAEALKAMENVSQYQQEINSLNPVLD